MGKGQPDGTFGTESGLLGNLYIAIQTLEHLIGTLKVGNSKQKYMIVIWICQNGYDFIYRNNFFGDCRIVNSPPPQTNIVLLKTKEIDKILVLIAGLQESALAFIMKKKKKQLSVSFRGTISSSFIVST